MSSSAEQVIGVIGAGPRGTSFMERLLAHVEAAGSSSRTRLRVKVFDPAPHGPGKVWNPAQSPLYLMNTPASYPTAAPTGDTQDELPVSSCSVSFAQYAKLHRLNYHDGDFPARSHYGQYLAWLNKEVSARLRGRGVAVDHIDEEVTSLKEHDGGYRLTTNQSTHQVGAAVLGLGHLHAVPGGPSGHLARTAGDLGLYYQGPAIPTDVDYDSFPAGENVLVRGMGLNFFDFLIQVTAGRGGQFREAAEPVAGHRYDYLPSGDEPAIIAGARRGTPYRAKTTAEGFVPAGVELHHLTHQRIEELAGEHHQLDFAEHLWPLIQADAFETYLRARGTDPDFDVAAYARPFGHQDFPSHQAYQEHMLRWLVEDAQSSAARERSPEKMAVNALHAARLRLKPLLSQGRITAASRLRDVEGWFESMVEGLASGPPLQRIEELAALVRAGVVEFLGPEPVYGVDRQAGCFIADSASVAGARYSAAHMIEAMMPPNRVTQAASPLVESLLSAGLARPAGFDVGSETHVHKGFAVTEQPYRLLNTQDQPGEALYVLGLQLSSAQWGTAIAAEAGGEAQTTAQTLADADAAAREILHRFGR